MKGLHGMSLELGLQGDVNVHVMKMAIEGVQVSVLAEMLVKTLHLFDVLQDVAVQKRLMRGFISLLKEDKEPSTAPVVATCVVDGVMVSWPSSLALQSDTSSSSGGLIEQSVAEIHRVMQTVDGSIGLLTALTTCPVLLPLPLESVNHLVRQCTLTRFAANATVLKQGEELKCMLIVLGGSVLEMCDVTFCIMPSVGLNAHNRR